MIENAILIFVMVGGMFVFYGMIKLWNEIKDPIQLYAYVWMLVLSIPVVAASMGAIVILMFKVLGFEINWP